MKRASRKSNESPSAVDCIAVTLLFNDRGHRYCIETCESLSKHGYRHIVTIAWALGAKGNKEELMLQDASVLGSIKSHLRACERCYYGDRK